MALTRLGLNQSINLASNVTGTLPVANGGTNLTSGFVNGGVNTPAFRATMSANQDNQTEAATVKVAFNTETFDEGSCYDHSSNYRFTVPSGEAGKYLIIAHIHVRSATGVEMSGKACRLYKNGSFLTESQHTHNTNELHPDRTNNEEVATIENLSAGDYIECYAKVWGRNFDIEAEGAYFAACKLII
jgi:hypothetical protein